jgi:hypothetical protein
VLAVPLEAVSSAHTVSVLRDRAWHTVAVETGIDDGHWIAIKEGLNAGETVSLER